MTTSAITITAQPTAQPAAAQPTIPLGHAHRPSAVTQVRTHQQREAVLAVISSGDFDFACNNPFAADVPADVTGPLTFLWYDLTGRLHGTRIAASGRLLKDYVR